MNKVTSTRTTSDFAAGLTLVLAASFSVFAMLHHPSSHSGGTSLVNALVHGSMMLLLASMFYGFAHVAIRRGLEQGQQLAGLVAYSVHVFAHLVAATINGFVVPALAKRENPEVGHDLFALCWELNQSSARLGVVAAGVAFVFWGLGYLARSGLGNKLIGATGIVCGMGSIFVLVFHNYSMDLHTALIIYSLHGLWTLIVGIDLLRNGCSSSSSSSD